MIVANIINIAVVGSRDFENPGIVQKCIDFLAEVDLRSPYYIQVSSGGARGVDRWVEHRCQERRLSFTLFQADWAAHGKAAGFIRNDALVDHASAVIAFWDNKSKGTLDMLSRSKARHLPTIVYTETGYGVFDFVSDSFLNIIPLPKKME